MFITEFTSDLHLTLPEPDQSSPYPPTQNFIFEMQNELYAHCLLLKGIRYDVNSLLDRDEVSKGNIKQFFLLFKCKNETHYFSRMNMKCHFPLSEHNEFCILFLKYSGVMRVWIEFANCLTHHVSFVNLIFGRRAVWHTHTHTHTSQYSETEWDGTRLLALDGQVLMFKFYYIPDQISFPQKTVTRDFVRFVHCLFPRLDFFYRKGSNLSI